MLSSNQLSTDEPVFLKDLSEDAQDFFAGSEFNLEWTIDSIQYRSSSKGYTPLMWALERDEKKIFQELLDAGANVNQPTTEYPPVLMLAFLLNKTWALKILHERSTLDNLLFNYYSNIPTGDWMMYKKGNTPLILTLKAAFETYDWTETEESFTRYQKVLEDFLSEENLDLKYHHGKQYPFNFLCGRLVSILDFTRYRFDFFCKIMKEFIDRGADVNFQDQKGKTAIWRLLDISWFVTAGSDLTPNSDEIQDGIIAAVAILFNQANDVNLKLSDDAVRTVLQMPKVLYALIAEIRAQAMKKICLLQIDPENAELDEKQIGELRKHSLEQFMRDLVSKITNGLDTNQPILTILKENVVSFIEELIKPNPKALKNIISTQELQHELKKAGFDLDAACDKPSRRNISLLEFASYYGYKEIIWAAALLPIFKQAFQDEKLMKRCLNLAIEKDHPACVDALLHFMPKPTLTYALKEAARYRNMGMMRYILEKFRTLRLTEGVKLDFDIIEPDIQFSVFSEVMKIKNRHWLITLLLDEIKGLAIKKGYTFSENINIKENSPPIERLKNFLNQLVGKHHNDHQEYLFEHVFDHIIKYQKHFENIATALQFYKKREFKIEEVRDNKRIERNLSVRPLNSNVVCNIFDFLNGPDKTFHHSYFKHIRFYAAKAAGVVLEDKKDDKNSSKRHKHKR